MVSESECLICQLSTSRWAVQVTANFPHVRRLWDCQSLLHSHWERERDSPGKERQAPTCSPSSLRLAGFCRQHLYSQWSLFPTWDIPSRFLWAWPVWWQKPLHFQGYSQEVWQEPPRKWWLAHEQTPQTGQRLRGQRLGDTTLLWTLRAGPFVVTLFGLLKVAEHKSYKPDFPWLEE